MEIYVHPTCTSCKKAEHLLHVSGIEATRRDYFKDRFTTDELRDVLDRAGMTPLEVLSTRSSAYKELGLAEKTLTNEILLELIPEHPTLIRRPLVIGKSGSVVGFNATKLADLIARER